MELPLEEESGVNEHVNLGAQVTFSVVSIQIIFRTFAFPQLWREYTGASEEELEAKAALWRSTAVNEEEEEDNENEALAWMIANALATEANFSKSNIVARGSVTFHPDESVPTFSPFAKGVTEEAVVVFSGSNPDDRAIQIRSCSLRLHTPGDPEESMLDIKMDTGDGLWKDYATYKAFISAFSPSLSDADRAQAVERWMLSSPANYQNACTAFVKEPQSVLGLVYNSSFPLALTADDGSKHFVKFRIIPTDSEEVTGRLEETDQKEMWNKLTLEADQEGEADYLKKELNGRITSQFANQVQLQIMTIEQEEVENLDLLIPGGDWGRSWHDLASLNLLDLCMKETEEQSPDCLNKIRFRCGNLPPGLSIIGHSGVADPNWWMAAKAKVDEALFNLHHILNSASTVEAEAERSGHTWKNYGRGIYQELTKSTDSEMAIKIAGDFSAWSPMPWTSEAEEPRKSMETKARLLGASTLQREWDTQVWRFSVKARFISANMFQVPATHPKGVTASGHLNMVAEDGVPNVPFFQTGENIAVKVSLSGFYSI